MNNKMNILARIVSQHLKGIRDCFDDEQEIAVATLAGLWGATIEYDSEQRDGLSGIHHPTYRFHADAFVIDQINRKLNLPNPEKLGQIGSKHLVLLLNDVIFKDVLPSIKDKKYVNQRFFNPYISLDDLRKRFKVKPKFDDIFLKALSKGTIWDNNLVELLDFDDPKVQNIDCYLKESYINEHKYDQETDKWLERKSDLSLNKSSINLNQKGRTEIFNRYDHACCRSSNCRSVSPLTGCLVFFRPESPYYPAVLSMFKHNKEMQDKIIASSHNIQLTTEHCISKRECKKENIDPDFNGNHIVMCMTCNSGLSDKPFVEKMRIIHSENPGLANHIYQNVISGLIENRYFEISQKIQKEMKDLLGF